jgi:chemotaxis protein MotB
MARKKYQEEHENHERWLVSYADFMTLLFAFFVVMYAISSVNDGKYRVLSESLTGAFRQNQVSGGKIPDVTQVAPLAVVPFPILKSKNGEALKKERDKMTSVAKDVMAVLEPLVREGKVRVTQTSRGVSIEINASVLFAPGEAKLSQDSYEALRVIATVLKSDDHAIQVEGFTDNLPINNSIFPSNWELSAVRASSVARLFMEQGVDENRLVAVGQGPKNPVGPNDTAEGRSRNRRVTVTILSMLPEPVVEVPVAASRK